MRIQTQLWWAHPRVCGENYAKWQDGLQVEGSSPRVRGKHRKGCARHTQTRLIPACAGKTLRTLATWARGRAHPRVCGENSENPCHMGTRTGSSPRVRGKHRPGLPDRLPRGLIPACAGKTRSRLAWSGGWRAHPRVCGENTGSDGGVEYWGGSSPRVRGKLRSVFPSEAPFRLIPACAGKTRKPRNHTGYGAAHPRVCGENHGVPMTSSDSTGSSPRVRGKPRCGARVRVDHGLIPACAGKTPTDPHTRKETKAPPRVCGENTTRTWVRESASGSSPRVRGKPRGLGADAGQGGLIPACAGKTDRSFQ